MMLFWFWYLPNENEADGNHTYFYLFLFKTRFWNVLGTLSIIVNTIPTAHILLMLFMTNLLYIDLGKLPPRNSALWN